jgi:hypothetical protein
MRTVVSQVGDGCFLLSLQVERSWVECCFGVLCSTDLCLITLTSHPRLAAGRFFPDDKCACACYHTGDMPALLQQLEIGEFNRVQRLVWA